MIINALIPFLGERPPQSSQAHSPPPLPHRDTSQPTHLPPAQSPPLPPLPRGAQRSLGLCRRGD